VKEILKDVELEIEKRRITPEEVAETISSIPPLLNRRIIMGYASVAMVDRENQKISIEALRDAVKRFMADGRYRIISIFHCLDGDTEILCCKKGNKYIPIKDIQKGDKVYSHTGVLRTVNEVLKYPVNGIVKKLYLSNDTEIIVTGEHPMLTRDRGWVKATDLLESDVLLHCPPKHMSEMGKKGGVTNKKRLSNKTYDEIFGITKSVEIKNKLSKKQKTIDHTKFIEVAKNNKGLTLSQIYGEEMAAKILEKIAVPRENYTVTDKHNSQQRKNRTWEEVYGHNKPYYGGCDGDKNPNWKDGIGRLPYDYNFGVKKNRIKLRDDYTCQSCGETEKSKLCVHHIDYDKMNSNDENLITLCRVCNSKVNYKRDYWADIFKSKMENRLQLANGTKILKIKNVWYTGIVYNLDVDIDHTYVGRGVVFHNSDAVVGRVLPKWTDPNTGKVYATEVDDVGWKVVVELRDDIELAEKVWDEIQKGNLRSFSVAGTSKKKHNETATGNPFTEIDELDLLECTICSVPVNPMSMFQVLWEGKDKVEI